MVGKSLLFENELVGYRVKSYDIFYDIASDLGVEFDTNGEIVLKLVGDALISSGEDKVEVIEIIDKKLAQSLKNKDRGTLLFAGFVEKLIAYKEVRVKVTLATARFLSLSLSYDLGDYILNLYIDFSLYRDGESTVITLSSTSMSTKTGEIVFSFPLDHCNLGLAKGSMTYKTMNSLVDFFKDIDRAWDCNDLRNLNSIKNILDDDCLMISDLNLSVTKSELKRIYDYILYYV